MVDDTRGPPVAWISVKVRPAFTSDRMDVTVWEGGYRRRSRLVLECEDVPVPFTRKAVEEIAVAMQEALDAAVRGFGDLDTAGIV